MLLAIGVSVGILLSLVSLLRISLEPEGPRLRPARLGTYATTLNAVIDTADFGLGRADTDVVKLSYWAPTYAQLLTSEPVLLRAEAKLGRRIAIDDEREKVTAEQVGPSPMIQLKVEAPTASQASATAKVLMDSLVEYIVDKQQTSATPVEQRLEVRVMGKPSTPKLVSNRRRELAFILFWLPIAGAVAMAYRLEGGGSRGHEYYPS